MPTIKRLYAWATPAFVQGAPVDHTWVTSYDNNINSYPNLAAVLAASEDYWYCWGGFHPRGGTPSIPDGALGSQPGDIDLARCLVASNADSATSFSARGTIFTYGVDGVCHQLANQALYATSIGGAVPLTVAQASGYWVSTAIYGSYGLQLAAWRAKIATCSAAVAAAAAPSGAVVNMNAPAPPNPPDEFEQHVGNVLGAGKLGVASQLLNMRAQFHTAAAAQAHAMVAPTADELNARNQRFLDDAAKLLSASDFVAIFGVPPGTKVDLVVADPTRASPGTP
jgi:hypothetical protein